MFNSEQESQKKLVSILLLWQAAKSRPGIIYEQTESTVEWRLRKTGAERGEQSRQAGKRKTLRRGHRFLLVPGPFGPIPLLSGDLCSSLFPRR